MVSTECVLPGTKSYPWASAVGVRGGVAVRGRHTALALCSMEKAAPYPQPLFLFHHLLVAVLVCPHLWCQSPDLHPVILQMFALHLQCTKMYLKPQQGRIYSKEGSSRFTLKISHLTSLQDGEICKSRAAVSQGPLQSAVFQQWYIEILYLWGISKSCGEKISPGNMYL